MTNVLTLSSPLMRQTVGFDRFSDLFENMLNDAPDSFDNYPPYNIEKTADDAYRISIAVAGFSDADLSVEVKEGALIVSAKKAEDDDGIIIRLYEAAQQSASATLQFGVRVQSVALVNLMETHIAPVPVQADAVTLDFRPFEIKTIKVWFAR